MPFFPNVFLNLNFERRVTTFLYANRVSRPKIKIQFRRSDARFGLKGRLLIFRKKNLLKWEMTTQAKTDGDFKFGKVWNLTNFPLKRRLSILTGVLKILPFSKWGSVRKELPRRTHV